LFLQKIIKTTEKLTKIIKKLPKAEIVEIYCFGLIFLKLRENKQFHMVKTDKIDTKIMKDVRKVNQVLYQLADKLVIATSGYNRQQTLIRLTG
jgi:capsule polysaccharide export protein KpsC/LpsZ